MCVYCRVQLSMHNKHKRLSCPVLTKRRVSVKQSKQSMSSSHQWTYLWVSCQSSNLGHYLQSLACSTPLDEMFLMFSVTAKETKLQRVNCRSFVPAQNCPSLIGHCCKGEKPSHRPENGQLLSQISRKRIWKPARVDMTLPCSGFRSGLQQTDSDFSNQSSCNL